MNRQNAQRFLIYCVTFFGPLGVLISPSFLPKAFRFYYFFLPLAPFLLTPLKAHQWKGILTFAPFISYCLISAYFTENKAVDYDAHPFFRSLLLTFQSLFMFGAARTFRNSAPSLGQKTLLRLYLVGYFFSLIAGYVMLFGYYTKRLSFETIAQFCVEAQIGWGIFRFSPGSYPNEYGNISSFILCALIILISHRTSFSFLLYFFAALTVIALILTTTRAAYYAFILSFIYLCFASKKVRRSSLKFLLGITVAFLAMKSYAFDAFSVFLEGIRAISLSTGSSGVRIKEWAKGFEQLGHSIFFGAGFGSHISMHNIYLELLYELGVLGALLLLVSIAYYLAQHHLKIREMLRQKGREEKEIIYQQVTIVGLFHVFFFALTNHNMHHHLTWLIFLFFNMNLFVEPHLTAPAAPKDAPSRFFGRQQRFLQFLR